MKNNSYQINFDVKNNLLNADEAICKHLDRFSLLNRSDISQDILSHLRNFIEAVFLLFYANNLPESTISYEYIEKAKSYIKSKGQLQFLYNFYSSLQISVSHYTLSEDNSERLMLKYVRNLIKIKEIVKEKFHINLLHNLNNFPLNLDSSLNEYYDKISEKLYSNFTLNTSYSESQKYYVQKIKPIFCKNHTFYEISITPAIDLLNKNNRIIVFSKNEIVENYSVKLRLKNDFIEYLGTKILVTFVDSWHVSIRTCEYKNFTYIVTGSKPDISYKEQDFLNNYLTQTQIPLNTIVSLNEEFESFSQLYCNQTKSQEFLEVLKKCKKIIDNNQKGKNILLYLLYFFNNSVIKKQLNQQPNNKLSELYLRNGCIPFDEMPYATSLIQHNPNFSFLENCISLDHKEHKLLARKIRLNTEENKELFTPLKSFELKVDEISKLVKNYNELLWIGHREIRKIMIDQGQLFINGYKKDTCDIIKKIQSFSHNGVDNYNSNINQWINNNNIIFDCDEKREAITKMFQTSKVAIIYGSAGVGKTTLVGYVSKFYSNEKKIFLSQTNTALSNLKRSTNTLNSDYFTVFDFVKNNHKLNNQCFLLAIDECSTISNRDMISILTYCKFEILLLVGDTYQINSIQFGNWFSALKCFTKNNVIELNKAYRTQNKNLVALWDRVRKNDQNIMEILTKSNFSSKLELSLLDYDHENKNDEIILCLQYDGLYGINNINRYLQEKNPNKAVSWGILNYKVDDPVIFNDNERFGHVLYDNLKGKIVRINITNYNSIEFDIEVPICINKNDQNNQYKLINCNNESSTVRFTVSQINDSDDDSSSQIVPFQIAYALSIHKAQGLEYDSVKIIIADECDNLITHDIFYTAITRARNSLKIFWSPEVCNKILSNFKTHNIGKDICLLKQYLPKDNVQ